MCVSVGVYVCRESRRPTDLIDGKYIFLSLSDFIQGSHYSIDTRSDLVKRTQCPPGCQSTLCFYLSYIFSTETNSSFCNPKVNASKAYILLKIVGLLSYMN